MTSVTKPIALDETLQRVATALESVVASKKTMTITCTSTDSVTVNNQTVKVYDMATGAVYKTIAYEGQPVTFDVPFGMSYKVVAICTLSMHYVDDKPTGIVQNNVSISISYKSLGTVTTFPQLKGVADAGLAKYIPIGTQVSFTHGVFGLHYFDVMDYNEQEDALLLVQNDCLSGLQFDAPEASYYAGTALPAGDYSINKGSTAYYFTTTQEIPAGGQIRLTTSQWWSYSSPYDTVQLETGTPSTTSISGATNLGTEGTGAINDANRISNGSNNYAESALGRWINSSGSANNWWTPSTHFDRPPIYTSQAGYVAGVPQEVLDCIETTAVKCYAYPGYAAPDSQYVKGATYTVNQRFFLLSEKEVYGSAVYDDGSQQLDAYAGTGNSAKIKKIGSSAQCWWLRSPTSDSRHERIVTTSGAGDTIPANYSYAVVPACIIKKSEIQ